MSDGKWTNVFEYLRSSNRDPEKVLKLLTSNKKGNESNYNINRSSYSLNVIATITEKIKDPKNKGKALRHIIRDWVVKADFIGFYNLLQYPKVYSRDKVENYVKQINDLWTKPQHKRFRKYFDATGGKVIFETGSKTSQVSKDGKKIKSLKDMNNNKSKKK